VDCRSGIGELYSLLPWNALAAQAVDRDEPVQTGTLKDRCMLTRAERVSTSGDTRASLVTIDWGFDIRNHIADACGLDTEIIRIDDLGKGIRAEYIETLVATKPISCTCVGTTIIE
jgi:hypothetical protein